MGFIGVHVCRALLMNGYHVVGFDNLSHPSIDPSGRMKSGTGDAWKNFRFYKVDIREKGPMHAMAAAERPDAIIHLAAIGSVPRSFTQPALYTSVNCVGFLNVLELAADLRIEKMIYASSSSVYGKSPSPVRREGMEFPAASPYALSKIHNENAARLMSVMMNVSTLGLRFFNVYGPGQNFDSAYSAVIPKWINSERLVINGDGETIRDFTYVGDVVDAVLLGLENQAFVASVCNIGTGKGTTINELAEMISQGQREIVPSKPRYGDVSASIADVDYAEKLLGFKARVTLEEGLSKTRQFYAGMV